MPRCVPQHTHFLYQHPLPNESYISFILLTCVPFSDLPNAALGNKLSWITWETVWEISLQLSNGRLSRRQLSKWHGLAQISTPLPILVFCFWWVGFWIQSQSQLKVFFNAFCKVCDLLGSVYSLRSGSSPMARILSEQMLEWLSRVTSTNHAPLLITQPIAVPHAHTLYYMAWS